MNEKKSFWPWWKTLPGILTGVATVITALSGLIFGLYQFGIIGGEPASTPAPVPSPAEFSLTISTDGKGTTSPSPGTYTYDKGDLVSIAALPDSDWEFDHWSGDYLGTSPTAIFSVDSDMVIIAYFKSAPAPAPTIYAITISVDGKGTTNPAPGSHPYDKGAQVSVTALPDSRWEFDHWGGDASGTSPSITVTMTSDKNITAYFTSTKIKYTLSTSVSLSGSGSVSPSSGTYDAGTQVNVTANPATFWKFDHWGGDASGTSPSITITMISDKNITAYFTKFYSSNTQLILALSGINTIGDLNGGKIAVISGASWDCALVALKIHGITCTRITIASSEIYTALQMGVIDAVLVAGHPSMFVPEDVNVLGWSDAAIQAVTNAFPEMVATLLPAGTYSGQGVDIKGYALR